MNVEQPAFVVQHKRSREDAHEAGKHYQVGLKPVNLLYERLVERFTTRVILMAEDFRGNACFSGANKPACIGPI